MINFLRLSLETILKTIIRERKNSFFKKKISKGSNNPSIQKLNLRITYINEKFYGILDRVIKICNLF